MRADPPVGDRVADGEDLAVVVPGIADDQLDAALLGQRGEGARIGRVDGHRLLEKEMKPAVEHGACERRMHACGTATIAASSSALLEHLGGVGEDPVGGIAKRSAARARFSGSGSAIAGDRRRRDLPASAGQMRPRRPPAAADHADPRAHASSARLRRSSS